MKRDAQTRVYRGNGNDEFSQENILCMIRRCYLADNEVWTPISRDERRFVVDFQFSVKTHRIVTVVDAIQTKL